MSLADIARPRREAAEAEAAAAAERGNAINSVYHMIDDAIEYLKSDLQYLNADEIANQFFHSLVKVNNVPADIVKDAAIDYLVCYDDCNAVTKYALHILIGMCTRA